MTTIQTKFYEKIIYHFNKISYNTGFSLNIITDNKYFNEEYYNALIHKYFKEKHHLIIKNRYPNEVIEPQFNKNLDNLFDNISFENNQIKLQIKNSPFILEKTKENTYNLLYKKSNNDSNDKNNPSYKKIYDTVIAPYSKENISSIENDGYILIEKSQLINNEKIYFLKNNDIYIRNNNINCLFIKKKQKDITTIEIINENYNNNNKENLISDQLSMIFVDNTITNEDLSQFIYNLNFLDYFHKINSKFEDNNIILTIEDYKKFYDEQSIQNKYWFGNKSTLKIMDKKIQGNDDFIIKVFSRILEFKYEYLIPEDLRNYLKKLQSNYYQTLYWVNWLALDTNWSFINNNTGIIIIDFLTFLSIKNFNSSENFIGSNINFSLNLLTGIRSSIINNKNYNISLGLLYCYKIGSNVNTVRSNINDHTFMDIIDNQYINLINKTQELKDFNEFLYESHWYNYIFIYWVFIYKKLKIMIIINPIELFFTKTINFYINISVEIYNNNINKKAFEYINDNIHKINNKFLYKIPKNTIINTIDI